VSYTIKGGHRRYTGVTKRGVFKEGALEILYSLAPGGGENTPGGKKRAGKPALSKGGTHLFSPPKEEVFPPE